MGQNSSSPVNTQKDSKKITMGYPSHPQKVPEVGFDPRTHLEIYDFIRIRSASLKIAASFRCFTGVSKVEQLLSFFVPFGEEDRRNDRSSSKREACGKCRKRVP